MASKTALEKYSESRPVGEPQCYVWTKDSSASAVHHKGNVYQYKGVWYCWRCLVQMIEMDAYLNRAHESVMPTIKVLSPGSIVQKIKVGKDILEFQAWPLEGKPAMRLVKPQKELGYPKTASGKA